LKTKSMADKHIFVVMVIAIAGILQGCSFMGIGKSDFDCKGGVDGVRCLSARQVYQATESSDYVKTKDDSKEDKNDSKGQPINNENPRNSQVAVPRIDQPVPIRTQAKVMRIWMAPWEDDDGDLHADGFMYTEIESRRWNLGDRFKSPGSAISPLSVATPSKSAK
jgi:conjugal transfer pilus assembly protein TraV